MAKSIIEEELAERTQKLREGLDKMIARHGVSGVWSPDERRARDEADRRKWLDETQNMRVVALNEAVKLAVAEIKNETSDVTAGIIVQVADVFAKFLIDGEVK